MPFFYLPFLKLNRHHHKLCSAPFFFKMMGDQPTNDTSVSAALENKKREGNKERQERFRAKKRAAQSLLTLGEKKAKTPPPTLREKLIFSVPPPRKISFPRGFPKAAATNQAIRPRNAAKEKLWCARSRLKLKMIGVLEELEGTLVELDKSGFEGQKRGSKKGSNFNWKFQFDVYNHSVRHELQSGYSVDHPDTVRHNIESKACPPSCLRVRLHSKEQMMEKLEGNAEQIELQQGSWSLVEKLIDGIPPLKEWAGANDYKVQFSMMTNSKKHVVKPHKDSADIAPQFSLCLGEYKGGELLTWG